MLSSLAHSVMMVKCSSWQVFGQLRCLLSAKCTQERVPDAEAQSVISTVGRNVTSVYVT